VTPAGGEVTRWLDELRGGNQQALDALLPLLYDELRQVARRLLRGERPGHTMSTTVLVHEAYLRLLDARRLAPADRGAFLGVAAVTMRRLLVDAARRRLADKRGGGVRAQSVDELAEVLAAPAPDQELVALDRALDTLGEASPRARQVVELRFFTGLSLQETAEALGTSVKTVQRDWLAARAWLRARVGGELAAADEPSPRGEVETP
jgi:RNA polymerase sigma factor (TIGR02999 family)